MSTNLRESSETPRVKAQRNRESYQQYVADLDEKEASSDEVPKAVHKAFKDKYPDGKVIGYLRVGGGRYGVYFVDKVWYKCACFASNGEFDQTRVTSLAKEARDKAKKTLRKVIRRRGFDILLLERVLTADGSRYWEAMADTDQGKRHIRFDDEGNILNRYEDDEDLDDDDDNKPEDIESDGDDDDSDDDYGDDDDGDSGDDSDDDD